MSDATETTIAVEPAEVDTTETVVDSAAEIEKWKSLSKKNEARAKENAAAAKRLAELEEAGKSEAQKAADRIAKAEAEAAAVPARIAEGLRDALVALGTVSEEDKVLLTASDPETLLAQVKRLSARSEDRKANGNRAPLQGKTAPAGKEDPVREFARGLFGRDE